jgi:phenylalanyl-tRNA synthetase beta chain
MIRFSPAAEPGADAESRKEKAAATLVGLGFHEMMNNSIVHSAHYTEEELKGGVKMMNSLSAELDMMRLSMLETGLQSIAHNLNRKNQNLRFFEFGKTYHKKDAGKYYEVEHLALFVSGLKQTEGWQSKPLSSDLYYLKGIIRNILAQFGLQEPTYKPEEQGRMGLCLTGELMKKKIVSLGLVHRKTLDQFDIRQDVLYADLNWQAILDLAAAQKLQYKELPKYPSVHRDLAVVVDRGLAWGRVSEALHTASMARLRGFELFDVFESDKLGQGKKSMAVSFQFRDEEKTLTDQEVDQMMQKIIRIFEKDLEAQVRR